MSVHTCRPGHAGVLADGCDRCEEHAEQPMLLELDRDKMAAMWDVMVAAEHGSGRYATEAEATAGKQLYRVAVWLERYALINPWVPVTELRKSWAR
jgi:hypothetical protein